MPSSPLYLKFETLCQVCVYPLYQREHYTGVTSMMPGTQLFSKWLTHQILNWTPFSISPFSFMGDQRKLGTIENGKLESGKLENGKLESGKLESGKLEMEAIGVGRKWDLFLFLTSCVGVLNVIWQI